MSVKDRILCALGFHGTFTLTDRVIRASYRSAPDKLVITGHIYVCSLCGRPKAFNV